jgi:tRNA (guanine37-N1)-methyltransferase
VNLGVVTLFPEMFSAISGYGITGRAFKKGLMTLECWNPRSFTTDRHQTVDNRPYGGGPGMVMKAAPLQAALQVARNRLPDAKVVYLSPQGRTFDQATANEFAKRSELILLCGRYEGIDERLLQLEVDEEWSIGDYVLSGGELPAMVCIDAIARLIPGVLGHEESALQDSFANNLLDYPHYTRPELYKELEVPAVLLSGHHEAIRAWRLNQSLQRTKQRRPDLLNGLKLNKEVSALLQAIDKPDQV